jgi:DNA polymerase elongation subunit (family B)
MIEVDVKKVDYTIRDWDDTDELKDELRSSKQDKDHIIREIEEHGAGLRPVIHIFGRSSGGSRVHLRVHGVKPYFYMPIDVYRGCDIQNDNRVIDTEKGYSSIQGDHMVKVCARIPGDVGGANSLREDYAPDDHYEADILFPNRFLIDSGIEGGIKVPSHHATPSPTDCHRLKSQNTTRKTGFASVT